MANPTREEIHKSNQGCGLNIVLPCRGEFGLKVRYHVPAVHAIPGPKLVCHEPGEECLYPSADLLWPVDRLADDERRGTHPRTDRAIIAGLRELFHRHYPNAKVIETRKGMPEARFVPAPHAPHLLKARVVICPRGRRYGAAKNWPHWDTLADLPGAFAAGAPDSSQDVACPKAWDHERFLDATVAAMRQADLVVSTCAGLAHLAVLCGTPLLLITHNGLVAPGPVMDPDGKVMEPRYWPVRFEEYYAAANHKNVPIRVWEEWDNPDGLKEWVLDIMAEKRRKCGR